MGTKFWYSTIGQLATRWPFPFLGVVRAYAHAQTIFQSFSERRSFCLSASASGAQKLRDEREREHTQNLLSASTN